MTVNVKLIAAGLLVMSGFVGGFFVSKGSDQALAHAVAAASGGGGGGESGQAAAAGSANGGGGGGPAAAPPPSSRGGPSAAAAGAGGGGSGSEKAASDAGGQAGGQERGRAEAAGGGRQDGAGSGAGQAGKATAESRSGAAKDPSAAARMPSASEVAAFLGGNTVDLGLDRKQRRLLTYFAPRGLRGDATGTALAVHRWDFRTVDFCKPDEAEQSACPDVRFRKDPGDHASGTRIGELLIYGERWVPVLKGNIAGFPDHIPFIDSSVSDTGAPPQRRAAVLKDAAAWAVLAEHAAADVSRRRASPDAPERIVAFAPDGKRLDMQRPGPDDLSSGLTIETGWWSFSKGLLCQGSGPRGSSATCFRPEAWGDTYVRLDPLKGGPRVDLMVLAESDDRQRRAGE